MNKKTQQVLFSSKKNDWETPQELFDQLDLRYGPLMMDVCASEENAKCPGWMDKGRDGLSLSWYLYKACWMNPPYGREIGKWVKKAYEESWLGCLVVCLLPSRTCTRWFHEYIYNQPNVEIVFIKGRLRFGGSRHSAPFPSMIVVFHPPKEGK
jgi:phage N-6-adenine-methyltransferase